MWCFANDRIKCDVSVSLGYTVSVSDFRDGRQLFDYLYKEHGVSIWCYSPSY